MKKSKKPGKIAQAILAEVVPKSREADSDEEDLTRAKVVDEDEDIDNDETWNLDFDDKPQRSDLRTQNAQILADTDKRYGGKRTSRKALKKEIGEIDDENEHASAELGFMFEAPDEDSNENEDAEGHSGVSDEEEAEESADEEMETEDENADSSKFENKNGDLDYSSFGADSDQEGSADESDEEENEEVVEEEEEDGGTKVLKNDLKAEVQKGLAIKKQLSDWDSLFECRIQIQKVLPKINQYPQQDVWASFTTTTTPDETFDGYVKNVKKAQTSLANLLDTLNELRVHLINQNPELKAAVLSNGKRGHSDDDEEDLDADEEVKVPAKKMKLKQYEEFLSAQHSSITMYRNMTIEKWNDKTRLATGHLKSKSFAGFESSTLQQIEHILADKSRLVRRTQLRRSAYHVLGQTAVTDDGADEATEKEYDAEVFDDDDFYHQLLRELIERKTEGITDPMLLGQKWLQIQRMRNKVKKKVDTRASKGRKTRFDIHAKLVNFMAPVYCESKLSEEAKNELFKSLFGKSTK